MMMTWIWIPTPSHRYDKKYEVNTGRKRDEGGGWEEGAPFDEGEAHRVLSSASTFFSMVNF